jgi:hypothetical protein
MLNKTRLLFFAGAALLTIATGFCIGVPENDSPSPSGVWTHGDTVLLFTTFPACKADDEPPHRFLQTLVSKDGGKTWAWRGPRLTWSNFEYIMDTGNEIWLAGDSYSAEGPAYDPFLVLFNADSMEWPQLKIYEGEDELMAVAHDDRNSNRFVAWVNHLMLPPGDPDADDGTDSTFLHESLDRGQTWHAVRKVKRIPKSAPGLHFFQEIPQRSGAWRIASTYHSSAAFLEHLEPDGSWRPAAKLPSPIQKSCEE